jgi:SAM-dependent methyltransferase
MMQAREFYDTLTAEIVDNALGLDTAQNQEAKRYYHALVDKPQLRPYYRYNWTRRTEPMVRLLRSLPKRDLPWQVLDAGCGLGTETIFWSSLRDDIQVSGVDLSAHRLRTARARHLAYERHLGKALNVRFLEQDVFSVLDAEQFDVVWTMEAISHIDPAEKFLADVFKNLGTSGHLVISDSHIWNPAMAWRVFKLRRRGVALRTTKTTSGGESVTYAQERLLSVMWLSRALKQVGFVSARTQLSIFFPSIFAQFPFMLSFCAQFDSLINQVPVIRNLGGIYTLVASK